MNTVMIVTGESSGDLYGSLLARALKEIRHDVRLIGVGGEKMMDAGVEIVSGISGALGFTEILPSIKRIRDSLRAAKNAIHDIHPDVVVLIDYPDFNFRIGKFAKRSGISVLYYVSPQVWAWRKGRIREMAGFVDRMAVILPLEEALYKNAGIQCEFVGHPAMEEIEEFERNNALNCKPINTEPRTPNSELRTPVIALLPGSRPNELKLLLPMFVDLAVLLRKEFPYSSLRLPLAPNTDKERFITYFHALSDKGVVIEEEGALNTLASSDAAVIASGTATLQAALLGVPMAVVYKVAPLTYFIGRMILDVKHISLVNVIGGREIVKEFIQHMARPELIIEELKKILYDYRYREDMISSFKDIRQQFSGRRPSVRVALMAGEAAAINETRQVLS